MRGLTAVLAIAGLTGCSTNESGNLAATKLGDTSHPLDRGSPIDALRGPCGQGARLDPTLRRRPYLQQLTGTSTLLGWVSMGDAPEHVELALPGEAARAIPSTIEPGNPRTAGEEQRWATLGDLTPGTVYCYALAGELPLSEPTGFRTAPDPASTETIRFLAFGDSGGGGSDQLALRDQMFGVPFDFMIHTGDIAYDNGTIGQFEDNVFGVYAELLENLALFPAAGNHDYQTLQGAPFRQVFSLPGDGGEQWYSYDYGRIHFAALDTEADYATQATWLDADLAATDRPWKIVYMHRPPYSSGDHGSDLALRGLLAPVFEARGVQLVLAGHDHDYERMIPQHGVAYVVTGGGGRGTRDVGSSSFTAFAEAVIHFVVVEVGVDQLILHAIDGTGVEFDSLVVPRIPASP